MVSKAELEDRNKNRNRNKQKKEIEIESEESKNFKQTNNRRWIGILIYEFNEQQRIAAATATTGETLEIEHKQSYLSKKVRVERSLLLVQACQPKAT